MTVSQINTIVDSVTGLPVPIDAEFVGGKYHPSHGIRDGMDEALGAMADAAATTDAGTFSLIALFKRLLGKLPTLGPKAAAGSVSVTLSTDDDLLLGSVTEAAPATDTASSGLNGRLQRIAQRVTALLSSTSLSDANRVPVSERDGLAVSGSVTSAAVLFTQDMLGYGGLTVQVTSAGTGCTITYENSDDNTTWYSCSGMGTSSINTLGATTSTALSIMQFPRKGRYFRARVSTYGSGTVAVAGTLSKMAQTVVVGANVAGTVTASGGAAHGAAISGNPNRVAARARNFGTPYAAVAADQVADLVSNLIGHLKTTREHSSAHIAGAATTTVKAGAGLLAKILVGTGAAGATATVYDSLTGTGTVVAIIDCANPRSMDLDVALSTGITIVTSGATDLTVAYL